MVESQVLDSDFILQATKGVRLFVHIAEAGASKRLQSVPAPQDHGLRYIASLLRIAHISSSCIAVETISIPNATEPADYIRPDLRFGANRAVLPCAKTCVELMKISQFLPIWTIFYKHIEGEVGLITCAGVILRQGSV
jgi:hypothetical protein